MTHLPPGSVHVTTAGGAYPVLIGCGILEELPELVASLAPGHRYAVISDARVATLYGETAVVRCTAAGLRADLFTFPEGEASKSRKRWSILTDELLDAGLGRDAVLIALGGGVTGDLAGFVAATYMRGIALVHVPTSMVAMMDASVGGKTGVDVKAGKNLVGAFHTPSAVIADPLTLRTLETRERAGGLAEAVKHGAILDREYFEELAGAAERLLGAEPEATEAAVRRSVEIKAAVVGGDEREAGRRQILNFGHTLGHAIEAASAYAVGHGQAVATGMVLEARLGERMGITDQGTADALADALARFELPGELPSALGPEVLAYTVRDKKARAGRERYVLLERIGSCHSTGGWSHEVPATLVREVVSHSLSRDGLQRP
jgi:3-dehydroquinate synthase